MIGLKSQMKQDRWANPRMRDQRKAWINAYRKRLTLMEIASGGLDDRSKSDQISEAIRTYRKLEPDLHNQELWPDDTLPHIVKSTVRRLELEVAGIRFGLDSDEYHRASARLNEELAEATAATTP